jgi:hypothetical protein
MQHVKRTVRARQTNDAGVRVTLPPLQFNQVGSIAVRLDDRRALVAVFDAPVSLFAGVHNDVTLHAPTHDLKNVHPSVARSVA